MKIAIDCRMMGHSGIGTFIANILPYLINHKEAEFLLVGDPEILRTFAEKENCTVVSCRFKPFSIKEQIAFPTKEVNRCDAFFSPNFNIPLGIKIPIFSTIHDIVFFDYPNFGSKLYKTIIRFFLLKAIRRSKMIFTVSHFSKYRISSVFNMRKPITVVYNGIKRNLLEYTRQHEDESYEREGIVFLGNLKPYKGIATLIEAYNRLREEGVKKSLTIIGNIDFRTKDEALLAKINQLKSYIHFVSHANDEEVFRLISHAEVLVSPSLYEGFGIPPLEAMFLGTPVIISDIPVYQEIYAQLPVTFFKAGDADDLAAKLKSFAPHEMHIQQELLQQYNYQKTAELIFQNLTINQ